MEKQNTPLIAFRKELENLYVWDGNKESYVLEKGDLEYLILQSLEKEKEFFIDFAVEYKHQCFQSDDPPSARTLFSQTFK